LQQQLGVPIGLMFSSLVLPVICSIFGGMVGPSTHV
jgi:hypothetical protein